MVGRRLVVALLLLALLPGMAWATRLKDITRVRGVRSNQLVGYGLVVGLKGTGDKQQVTFTMQALANMAERLGGLKVSTGTLRAQNVATVMITAELPPFATVGNNLDITVSSVGDCQSLQGGTLLLAPLKGIDDQIYALAQGPVVVGGYAVGGAGGGGAQKNHPTVARIVGGATVEREIPVALASSGSLLLALEQPDFTTAERVAQVVNGHLGGAWAQALDAGRIKLAVPPSYRERPALLLAELERLEVCPDTIAKIVLNERTGTVVMGENVRLSTLAVAHGNLSIVVKEQVNVSQAQPLAPGGQTVATPETNVQVQEGENKLVLIPAGVSIGEIVRGLNAVGVTPRDLITIFQAMKAAGALQAELEVI
ncbi:MAG: flagellar basal body P-ring protein FlgI [Pseudomonadota bacterium]